jgi:hypothetical protein
VVAICCRCSTGRNTRRAHRQFDHRSCGEPCFEAIAYFAVKPCKERSAHTWTKSAIAAGASTALVQRAICAPPW